MERNDESRIFFSDIQDTIKIIDCWFLNMQRQNISSIFLTKKTLSTIYK